MVRALEGRAGDGVELVEGGVYCADLFGSISGKRKAVFIDAMDAGEEPGAVFQFSPEEVKPKQGVSMSVHDFGLYELISTSRLTGDCPEEIVIFAVQVAVLDLGETLSDAVAAAVPRVCDLVLDEIGRPARRALGEVDEKPQG